MKIGLISHSIYSDNLGCSALAISNLKLMDEVFEKYDIDVEYVVILPASGKDYDREAFTSLAGYTKNPFSYREYPRPKNLLLKPWLLKTTDAFDGCDYVIDLCGGDGYTDNYGKKRILAESIPVFGCRYNKITCFFAPQTIGPFQTRLGRFVAKATLKKLRAIFVRDQSSYECCKELGFAKKTLLVTDVAFALPYQKKEFDHDKMNIGINVSGLLYNGGYNYDNYFNLSFSYKEFIDRLLEALCEDENVQVHLIPHVIYQNANVDDDYSVSETLKERFPNVILPERFATASNAKGYIAGMDMFTGARMHSTIAATSSGVPVVPVAYSRKVNGLYGTLEYPYYIDAKSDMTVDDALNQFFEYKNQLPEMRNALDNAKVIYRKKLKTYQRLLVKVMRLK